MKGNNGLGNVIQRDIWQTPQVLFNALNSQYKFTFDCCADAKNRKVAHYADDFLKFKFREIKGCCWMNPPFSKAYEMFKQFFEVVDSGVAIYRCDNMETSVWQEVILKNCNWVFIPKGRIGYEGMDGTGSRFPSALIGFNVDIPMSINGNVLFNEFSHGTK